MWGLLPSVGCHMNLKSVHDQFSSVNGSLYKLYIEITYEKATAGNNSCKFFIAKGSKYPASV
jgi:hypothetical protein